MSIVRSEADSAQANFHGGRLIARRLKAHGVSKLFTLSGGHLFSIYDGCREEGIEIVDTRHEQTAAFAAEGWAKVTREIGVCALTAGPGVTNGMSALASAQQNNSPMLMLAGRAPAWRWGQGSLQEIDHVPFVRPLAKSAETADSPGEIAGLVDEAIETAMAPHPGPVFLDFPLDHVFSEAPDPGTDAMPVAPWRDHGASQELIDRAAVLLADAERPVIMAGTGLYWGHGEERLRALAEALQVPVFVNGLGRGCFPADHDLHFSRARGYALGHADVALVIGVPLDFRLAFGGSFDDDAEVIVLDAAEPARDHPRAVSAELYGALPATLEGIRVSVGKPDETVMAGRRRWLEDIAEQERAGRSQEDEGRADMRSPMHPLRVYAELSELLDRDAIIVGDGGDFVSYAGRVIDSYRPGCWLDPGPFGCLGSGPGYALAAKLAHPGRQVVMLQGDGAFGFAGMDFDTLARHGVAVISVMGNNGIWALEKHPMEAIYGYSVAAELRPETRYDELVQTLGCHGELVRSPGELRGAFERSLASGKPALINVLTDPAVAYPRRSNLA